ncbi:H/ACA ribonucleoprotein complex subunit nhp2 [Dictyocoela muelleri]|nr:H/ACA ribonucleoprotein complex subunit nhp2 [Dictyocoela muelleri]
MLPFAIPLADKKTEKRTKKIIKKTESPLYRGRKACIKSIDKGNKGILFISSDISPMDLVSHLPYYCEENNIPYIFVKKDILRCASEKKNLTTCVFISENMDSMIYKKILKFINKNKILIQ